MEHWFAVKSKPRREVQAAQELTRRGIEAYLPQIARRRPNPGGSRLEPLFPGYLFARLATGSSDWAMARTTPGVAYFLGGRDEPCPLPDELIELIQLRAASSQAGWQPPFKRNERVTIERGPFAGMAAVFEGALSPAGRVRVLLETINRLVPVDLDITYLGRVS